MIFLFTASELRNRCGHSQFRRFERRCGPTVSPLIDQCLRCDEPHGIAQHIVFLDVDSFTVKAHRQATIWIHRRSLPKAKHFLEALSVVRLGASGTGFWSNQLRLECRLDPTNPLVILESRFMLNFKVVHLRISNDSFIEIVGTHSNGRWNMSYM